MKTGLVLGSGLGSLVGRVEVSETVSFAEAGLPGAGVPGHDGIFALGNLGELEVVVMRGRVHLYEGHAVATVTAGVRWMAERGVKSLVLTNAAASLRKRHRPGSWMVIDDQINLTGVSPLEGGPNFFDMSHMYDIEWREEFLAICEARGLDVCRGVYAGVRGPQYETPAEVRMLRTLGADAVGMSTVLEAIQARALGMRVLGLSCLTNLGAGIQGSEPNHDEVMKVAHDGADAMIDALEAWARRAG